MGNIDDAVPFFGVGFNKVYPLIMVIYTLLVASNFFDRVIKYFGSWKWFRVQSETDDTDGFDASGVIILQKERSWLEQGLKVGEHVIPLARNFNNSSIDLESGSDAMEKNAVELKAPDSRVIPSKEESRKHSTSREAIGNKYAAIRHEESRRESNTKPEKNITSVSSVNVSLLGAENSSGKTESSGLSSKWQSMKTGFQSFKANIGTKKFLPLRQVPDTQVVNRGSSSESLDDIFQRLKRPPVNHTELSDEDDNDIQIGCMPNQ